MNFVFYFLILIIVTEAITELIVKSVIFSSIRERILELNNDFLSKVISCGYCFSVWSSLFVNILYFSCIDTSDFKTKVILFFLSWLSIHRLSNYLHNFNDKHLDKFYSSKKD